MSKENRNPYSNAEGIQVCPPRFFSHMFALRYSRSLSVVYDKFSAWLFRISFEGIGFPASVFGSDICKKCELKQLNVVYAHEIITCFSAVLVTVCD